MADEARAAGTPAAFLSYAHADDRYEGGRVSELRRRLSGAVRVATGEDFPIFQDRNDIGWGESWKARIDEALDSVTFLIPVVTPSFMRSGPCRDEVARFLDRERRLGRNDLILPIYYVRVPELEDRGPDGGDGLVRLLRSHQHVDWRELRFEHFESPTVRRALAALARQLRDGLDRRTAIGRVAPSGRPAATGHRTRVVDPLGRGAHRTIAAALRVAADGDRVLVRPGLYREAVLLERPLELVGDGAVEDIVVQARNGPTLAFRATHGSVTGLTLRAGDESVDHGTVEITAGRLVLDRCRLSATGSCAISVRAGADPRVRRNRISGGLGRGIWVRDRATGTFEDNDILESARSGIAVSGGGIPVVRGNKILRGRGPGIFVHEKGAGLIEDNDIVGNATVGVAVESGGRLTVRGNRIQDSGDVGVRVYGKGMATITDNDIIGNANCGVAIDSGGRAEVRGNRIRGNRGAGVYDDGGSGVVEDNELQDNARGAWHGPFTDITRARNQV